MENPEYVLFVAPLSRSKNIVEATACSDTRLYSQQKSRLLDTMSIDFRGAWDGALHLVPYFSFVHRK